MNRSYYTFIIIVIFLNLFGVARAAERPNVTLILTDNQSPWTLGAYGNEEIRTPNIDRLAAEGMLFTDAFSTNPVCSPNRATLLTGLIPSQHGVHSFLVGGPGVQMGPDSYNTIEEFLSLPQILSEAGYVAGLSGKWHLGDSIKPHEGFSYWYTIPYGSSVFYDADVIWKGEVHTEPAYLTEAITDQGIEFIEQNQEGPFFLFLSYHGPYGLGNEFRKTHQNRHTEFYSDKVLNSFPREPSHPWLYNNRDMINNPITIRGYAAAVSGVDDGVGRIMDTLARLQLDENTLVIFVGDQGLAGGHHGIWGMGDHTRPVYTFEEGIRVPLIYRHPGRIPAGAVCDLLVGNYDLLPTVLSYLGLADEVPSKPALPGRDYSRALEGRQIDWEDVIFWEFENTRMIRTKDWKYTRRHPDGPDELYDMKNTPGERVNFIRNEAYTDIQEMLRRRLDEFFERFADPQYDLLKGGRSKARIHLR